MGSSNLVLLGEEGKAFVTNFFQIFIKYAAVFILLTINLIAVSLALLCHQNDALFSKIFIALFAFMFGIIYIVFNYYTYRILMKGQTCSYNGSVFPF